MPPLFQVTTGLGARRWIIVAIGCIFAVWAGVTLSEQPFAVFAVFAAGVYLGTLAVNGRVLAWLVIALQPAALIVPFFPGRPFFWELCTLLAWPSLVAHFLINRRQVEQLHFDQAEQRSLLSLCGYLVVIFVLMACRGVGFRAFGGDQMGGRFYGQQIILAILPLLMLTMRLTKRQLLAAMITGWVMSLTYLISDFSFSLGSGGIQKILYFFELPTDALNFEQGYEITGMRRYQSLATCASALLGLLWTWVPLRDLVGRWALVGVPLLIGCLGLGLGSGHRTLLIVATSTFLFLTFFQRFWNPLRAVFALVIVSGLMAGLYVVADQLPLSVQRSISFLPGIQVSALAQHDAATTLSDRIEVLKLAMGDVPKYWLLGRGFGMERLDLLPLDPAHEGVWLQYANGLFYNGTIGLFLKTGVPGLIFAALFVFWISRVAIDVIRLVRRRSTSEQDWFDRLSLLLCAQWFSTVAFFHLTHGDAAAWMQVFSLNAALLLACRRVLREPQNPHALGAEPKIA